MNKTYTRTGRNNRKSDNGFALENNLVLKILSLGRPSKRIAG